MPSGTKLVYTFKSDVLFKMLFVRYPDIHMMVDGQRVNLEIQIEDEGNFPERGMFQWAKMFTSSLSAGNDYSLLPKTIVISILGFRQFDCEEVHSEFAPMEITRHEILSDKQRYHFFELPKLPNVDAIDTTSEKDLWLALFNAQTEQELEKLIASGGEVMSQAVEAYRGITATEEFRYLEYLRTKTGHDEAQALRNAERKRDAHWQGVVAQKDTALAQRDTALANEKAENEKLRQQLAALQASQN